MHQLQKWIKTKQLCQMNQARLGKIMLPELKPIEKLSREAAQHEIAKLQDDLRQYGIA